MPHRFPYFLEFLQSGFAGTILASSSSLLLAQTAVTAEAVEATIEIRLLILPLIGGILTMGAAVFLNPNIETMRISLGRAFLGIFLCIIAPQIIALFHPGLKDIATKPIMLMLIGGGAAMLGFILSRPLVRGLYERSDRLSTHALDTAEKRFTEPPTTRTP